MRNEDLNDMKLRLAREILDKYGFGATLDSENEAKLDFGCSNFGQQFSIIIKDRSDFLRKIPYDKDMIDPKYYVLTGDKETVPYESYSKVIDGVEVKFLMEHRSILQMSYTFSISYKNGSTLYKGESIQSTNVIELKQNAEAEASRHVAFIKLENARRESYERHTI